MTDEQINVQSEVCPFSVMCKASGKTIYIKIKLPFVYEHPYLKLCHNNKIHRRKNTSQIGKEWRDKQ